MNAAMPAQAGMPRSPQEPIAWIGTMTFVWHIRTKGTLQGTYVR
jgi:hypothetical protein